MFTFCRSQASGNCLYSSASLRLVGNNSLVKDLRCLTSIELALNSPFYAKHKCFNVSEAFSINNFSVSLSFSTVDADLSANDAVIKEAENNCIDKKWSSFICGLGLSSVLRRKIQTFYPEFGQTKYFNLFNQTVEPRLSVIFNEPLHLLFCREGFVSGPIFNYNHYVPLLFLNSSAIENNKHKLISDNTNIPNKKLNLETSSNNKLVSNFFKPVQSHVKTQVNSSVPSSAALLAASSSHTNKKVVSSSIIVKPILPDFNDISNLLHPFDICTYRARLDNKEDIHFLIKNVFVPDASYVFPNNNGRSFLRKWLSEHSWLRYSDHLNGGFCLPCVLFGHKVKSKSNRAKKLVSEPLIPVPNAKSILKSHTSTKNGLHQETILIFNELSSQQVGCSTSVDKLIDTTYARKVADNRTKLIPIIDTIILCGRLGLSLRGHRDDSKYFPNAGEYSLNSTGNFIELLNFRYRGGDVNVINHFKDLNKNASYISKTTQNELINCCGEVISDQILSEIKKNKFFTILADEVIDSSGKSQMSLVIRYINSEFNVKEDFLSYIHCEEGLSGEALTNVLLKTLKSFSLDLKDC